MPVSVDRCADHTRHCAVITLAGPCDLGEMTYWSCVLLAHRVSTAQCAATLAAAVRILNIL